MSQTIHVLLTLLFCYLMGSILFCLIISETVYGVDIRNYGSGNVGFTNIKRALGWKPAIAVLFLDMLKGVSAVLTCHLLFASTGQLQSLLVVTGGILAIIGHNWSAFYNFAGGKGVATSLGVLFALDWRAGCLAMAVGIPMLVYPGYMSLASIVSTAMVPIWLWLLGAPVPYRVFGGIAFLFVLVRHRPNIDRLLKGVEPRFSFSGSGRIETADLSAAPEEPS